MADKITLIERFVTAFVSGVAATITLFGYFAINFALASKSPSGPPSWLFEFFTSKLSLGLVAFASALGFLLGSSRMAEVFAVLWGTSKLWQEAWFNKLAAAVVVVVVVLVAVHLLHGISG